MLSLYTPIKVVTVVVNYDFYWKENLFMSIKIFYQSLSTKLNEILLIILIIIVILEISRYYPVIPNSSL